MKSNLAITLLASAVQAQQDFAFAHQADYNLHEDAHEVHQPHLGHEYQYYNEET